MLQAHARIVALESVQVTPDVSLVKVGSFACYKETRLCLWRLRRLPTVTSQVQGQRRGVWTATAPRS